MSALVIPDAEQTTSHVSYSILITVKQKTLRVSNPFRNPRDQFSVDSRQNINFSSLRKLSPVSNRYNLLDCCAGKDFIRPFSYIETSDWGKSSMPCHPRPLTVNLDLRNVTGMSYTTRDPSTFLRRCHCKR